MKIVQKHWGYEEWLDLNSRYCFKKIFLKAGCRTSLQYHEKKCETNYIASGTGLLTLGDKVGELETREIGPNSVIPIPAGKIHRITAVTDLLMYEVSTPEVDDVIRLEDDKNRPNGYIEYEHQKKN